MARDGRPCRVRRVDHATRTVTILGHRTSIAMEPALWAVFDRVVAHRGGTPAALMAEIDKRRRPGGSFTSALRVFLVTWLVARADAGARPGRANLRAMDATAATAAERRLSA